MSDENWDDEDSAATPVPVAQNFGTNFGMGRGFIPKAQSNNSGSSGFETMKDGSSCGRLGGYRDENSNDGFQKTDDEYNNNSGGFKTARGGQGGGFGTRRGGGGRRDHAREYQGNQEGNDYCDNGGEYTPNRGRSNYGDDRGYKGGRGENRYGNDDGGSGGGYRGSHSNNRHSGEHIRGDHERNDYAGGRDGHGDSHRYGGGGDHGDCGNDRPEKPREIYIPPERADDDETLFGSGVKAGINFSKYESIEVQTSGENVPNPILSFNDANLRSLLQQNIEKSGYQVPTPIQKHGIPIIMQGRDLMACAQTGSGKTAAFLIPIIHKLLEKSRDFSNMASASVVEPRVVIMSPTRELAIQIYDEARKFSKGSTLKSVVVYGGTAVGHQLKNIFNGCDILVGTPGRLLDYVGRGKIVFSSIEFVVLDEADKMIDKDFIDKIEKVLQHDTMVPIGERQTLMFSATFPDEIQKLAVHYLNNYIFLTVGIVGSACTDIEQTFYEVGKKDKRSKLKELLEIELDNKSLHRILVFVDQKRTADFVAALLSENGFPTTSIHGDRLQREREEALDDFKSGRMAILVATSVAARGLDINVRYVINFDLPKGIDEYIHRIGRTGRVGNKGKAVSFYDDSVDSRLKPDLVRILTQANQEVPDWLSSGAKRDNYGPLSNFGGQDIRSFSDVQNSEKEGAQPVEDDEEW